MIDSLRASNFSIYLTYHEIWWYLRPCYPPTIIVLPSDDDSIVPLDILMLLKRRILRKALGDPPVFIRKLTWQYQKVPRPQRLWQVLFSTRSFYSSVASIIFSRSLRRLMSPFLLCFRSFSCLLLIAFNSSSLISAAFFTVLGMCLCRFILRISGICLYLSLRASSYSNFCRWRADLIPSRWDALVRQSLTLPSSDPVKRNRESGVNLAQKTLVKLDATNTNETQSRIPLHPFCMINVSGATSATVPETYCPIVRCTY